MAKEEKIIYVYDHFTGNAPVLLGKLNVGIIKGGEAYSFEYNKDWLAENKLQLNLVPELLPFTGRQFPAEKNIFGIFADASSDEEEDLLISRFKVMEVEG